jgi:hypothetical protein
MLELLVLHVIGIYLMGWSQWRYVGLVIFSIANGTLFAFFLSRFIYLMFAILFYYF